MFLLFMAGLSCRAQSVSVSGQVCDSLTAEPLEGAAVRVFLTDSTLVTGVAAGKDGKFVCKVAPGRKYLLNVSFLGYVGQWRMVAPSLQTDSMPLGRFRLVADVVRLKETQVAVQQLMIITKGDTIVYNADAFKPGETDLLKDLFKKIPGIEIEGNSVKVNGKPVSRILINGEDFFGNDASKALENLPAYMVKDVKAYEKEDEKNRITRFDDGQREQVLDVTLKAKYLNAWLANVAAGYGTEDMYMGRLFANRFDEKHRISAYGATANTNERPRADGSGQWNVGTRTNGTMDFVSGGVDVLYGNRKAVNDRNYVKLTGKVAADNEIMTDRGGRFVEQYRAGVSSYSLEDNGYRDRNFSLKSSFQLDWRPSTSSFITLTPSLGYGKGNGKGWSRSGTWNENPYALSVAPLDSLLANPALFGTTAVNSRLDDGRQYHEYRDASLGFWANWWVTSDGCNFTLRGDLQYRNEKTDDYDREGYNYYQPGQEERDEFRNIYARSPASFRSGRFFLDYVHVFKNGLRLRGTYGLYKGYHDDRGHYRYRLDELGDPWDDPTKVVLGLRPDDVEMLVRALDMRNSYDSELHGTHHWIETGLNWDWKKKVSIFGQFGVQPYTDVVDYRRDGVSKHLSKSYLHIAPSARIKYVTDSLGTLEFNYYNSFTGDYMLRNLIDMTDDTDPLNIRMGNPNLKGYYTHKFGGKYSHFNKRKQNFSLSLSHSYGTGAVSYVQRYDPSTGITVIRPENTEGDRDWHLSGSVNLPLDKKNRWNLSPGFDGRTYRSVEYSMLSGATESARDVVRTYHISPRLQLSYRQDKFGASCNTSFRISALDSRLGLNERSIRTVSCYGYAWGNLPGSIRVHTTVSLSRPYGYDDPSMNRAYTVWDILVEKTCLRKKNLTLTLSAHDILRQRMNHGSYLSGDRRTAWWGVGTTDYVMFGFNYKLQSKKKD